METITSLHWLSDIDSGMANTEKKKIAAKELIVLSLFAAFMHVFQIALAFLPNIEVVSLLVILCTLIYGKKTLYPIYLFAVVQGLMYGFGIWWFMYLYVWTVLWAVVMLLPHTDSPILWAIVSGLFGFLFGLLCSIPYLFIGGLKMAIAYWIAGIPFDLVHGVGNAVVAMVLVRPLYRVLLKLKN